jgi:hypothetical protein
MMEAIRSSEIWVLTRANWHNITEDGILHGHHYENLKPYREWIDLYNEWHHNFYFLPKCNRGDYIKKDEMDTWRK